MIKIKNDILTSFFKKVRMNGKQKITEGILIFDKDGLKISANSQAQLARTMGWLKKEAFVSYEEIGKVALNDMDNVEKVLNRFSDVITLEKTGNVLVIKGDSKKVDIELIHEDFLKTDITEPTLQFTDTFVTNASVLKQVFADVQINKDSVITITTEDKKVKFLNTGKYKFLTEIATPSVKGGVTVNFGEPLIEATQLLEGNLEISISNDYPMKVRELTEFSIITIIVAPRIDSE